jgi:hypothetical protein
MDGCRFLNKKIHFSHSIFFVKLLISQMDFFYPHLSLFPFSKKKKKLSLLFLNFFFVIFRKLRKILILLHVIFISHERTKKKQKEKAVKQ